MLRSRAASHMGEERKRPSSPIHPQSPAQEVPPEAGEIMRRIAEAEQLERVGRLVIWAWNTCLILCMTGYFWPCMAAQVKEHVRKCCPCLAFKARQPKAPLENIVATHPLELVHLDYLCLEPGKGLDENVLVVTDHFTRYAQAYVTRTQTTQMTAKTLWDKFIVHHGLLEKILMDQG